MICQHCKAEIPDTSKFCPTCGTQQAAQQQPQRVQPQPAPQQYQQSAQPQPAPQQYQQYQQSAQPKQPSIATNVDFIGAIKRCFSNYCEFNGRATRSEYWWVYLFNVLITPLYCIPVIGWIASLAIFLPVLGCLIRRLHDAGYSWVYYLVSLIPIAGPFILIYFLAKPSVPDNQWGPAAPGTVPAMNYQPYPNYQPYQNYQNYQNTANPAPMNYNAQPNTPAAGTPVNPAPAADNTVPENNNQQ